MNQEQINNIVIESLNDIRSVKRKKINFPKLLSKVNPYSLATSCITADNIVDYVLLKHKQTSSETIWGNYLELIALKISTQTLNAFKSKESCTDLEWVTENKNHYRGWKSSPNWANADLKTTANNKERELNSRDNFGSYKVLTSYGKTQKRKSTKSFVQLSGQDAWDEITNDSEMYNKVIIAIDHNRDQINMFLESIYESDKEKSVQWVKTNFEGDNKIDYTKINQYISGRDRLHTTKF